MPAFADRGTGPGQSWHQPAHALVALARIAPERADSLLPAFGGHTTWSSFAKEGLVDEIYLDIEPYLFGQGMPLFLPADFEYHLKLIETKNLNSQTLQLHYRVEK